MGIKKIVYILSFVAFLLTLSSCSLRKVKETKKAKTEFTVKNGAIPPEFGQDSETYLVLVKRTKKRYNKFMEKALQKYYTGKYIVLSRAQLQSGDYDSSKYRYEFDYDKGTKYQFYNPQTGKTYQPKFFKRYFVNDRLNDKKYKCGAEFTYFGNAMKVYFQNLELKRKS